MGKMSDAASGVSGILALDKPPDITSAAATARVKKLLGVKKIGHTGTLDPFATGVMILCINQATRLSRFFLHGRKTYEAVMMLGVATDTQDGTGAVVSRTPPENIRFTEREIQETVMGFTGEIDQLPPVYSALKHQGTPLYKLARQGAPVQKAARRITIDQIRLTHIALPEVRFVATCSAGTYIRTLCSDIGQALGCGGHLAALRRIESGGYAADQAVSLTELARLADEGRAMERIIPMAETLKWVPTHEADSALAERIRHGKPLTGREIPPETAGPDGLVKLTAEDARAPRRLLAVVEWRADEARYDYCCVFH